MSRRASVVLEGGAALAEFEMEGSPIGADREMRSANVGVRPLYWCQVARDVDELEGRHFMRILTVAAKAWISHAGSVGGRGLKNDGSNGTEAEDPERDAHGALASTRHARNATLRRRGIHRELHRGRSERDRGFTFAEVTERTTPSEGTWVPTDADGVHVRLVNPRISVGCARPFLSADTGAGPVA